MKKGIFCISIDVELLWGRKDLDYSKFINLTKKERIIIKKLLKLFKKYNIPATWAVVGKLYENGDKLWSGKDIIDLIKKNKIHELASHSYSHEDFTKISKNIAEKEFKKPLAFSFIYPRNHIAYLDLLKKNGFKAYRAKDKNEFELILPRIPPTDKVRIKNGLKEIPCSMYFVSARGFKKYIPFGLRFLKSVFGINRAIKRKEIFHIWFHPVDFANNTKSLFKELELLLIYIDKKRQNNLIEVKTMQQISNSL
ncbi:hypothetical protein BH10PAT1_BH10PAT1_6030 [soil metagenome]